MSAEKLAEMADIERRVLAHLDQHGPRHRTYVVADLSAPGTRHGDGIHNGSNGATPLIMGRWCARLIKRGYVVCAYDRDGFYREHRITEKGKAALRDHLSTRPSGEGG